MSVVAAAISGVVFAVGLAVSGMTRPGKVMAFLDFAGDWDPSLAFVMGGAVVVYGVIYRVAMAGRFPSYMAPALVAASAPIDARLVVGSALFGIGWGMAGFCPGPAIVALGTGAVPAAVFGVSMLAGMGLFQLVSGMLDRPRGDAGAGASGAVAGSRG